MTDPDDEFRIDADHIQRLLDFSRSTFGPKFRPKGLLDHISKEVVEAGDAPHDLSEWIDIAILGLLGAVWSGHSPQEVLDAMLEKQKINEERSWPDWRSAPEDKAIEHIKDKEEVVQVANERERAQITWDDAANGWRAIHPTHGPSPAYSRYFEVVRYCIANEWGMQHASMDELEQGASIAAADQNFQQAVDLSLTREGDEHVIVEVNQLPNGEYQARQVGQEGGIRFGSREEAEAYVGASPNWSLAKPIPLSDPSLDIPDQEIAAQLGLGQENMPEIDLILEKNEDKYQIVGKQQRYAVQFDTAEQAFDFFNEHERDYGWNLEMSEAVREEYRSELSPDTVIEKDVQAQASPGEPEDIIVSNQADFKDRLDASLAEHRADNEARVIRGEHPLPYFPDPEMTYEAITNPELMSGFSEAITDYNADWISSVVDPTIVDPGVVTDETLSAEAERLRAQSAEFGQGPEGPELGSDPYMESMGFAVPPADPDVGLSEEERHILGFNEGERTVSEGFDQDRARRDEHINEQLDGYQSSVNPPGDQPEELGKGNVRYTPEERAQAAREAENHPLDEPNLKGFYADPAEHVEAAGNPNEVRDRYLRSEEEAWRKDIRKEEWTNTAPENAPERPDDGPEPPEAGPEEPRDGGGGSPRPEEPSPGNAPGGATADERAEHIEDALRSYQLAPEQVRVDQVRIELPTEEPAPTPDDPATAPRPDDKPYTPGSGEVDIYGGLDIHPEAYDPRPDPASMDHHPYTNPEVDVDREARDIDPLTDAPTAPRYQQYAQELRMLSATSTEPEALRAAATAMENFPSANDAVDRMPRKGRAKSGDPLKKRVGKTLGR